MSLLYWIRTWRLGRRIAKVEHRPHVIRAAWPQQAPKDGEEKTWWFSCGDCRVVFESRVKNALPSSFHPECPGCAEKLLLYLAERGKTEP